MSIIHHFKKQIVKYFFQIAKNFTLAVTNRNEKPETVKILETEKVKKMEIPECTLIDDVVGTLMASDPDQSDKLTFTLIETGSDIFKLSSASPDCKQVENLVMY